MTHQGIILLQDKPVARTMQIVRRSKLKFWSNPNLSPVTVLGDKEMY